MNNTSRLFLVMMLFATSLCTRAQRYVGGDISMLPFYETAGSTYLDSSSTTISSSLIAYLKAQGWNSMRVRLFVDPATYKATDATYWNEGACQSLNDVKALGKRIKDAGLKFMLDIHYSDTWTDPEKHLAPARWTNSSAYSDSMYAYTKEVLETLVAYGATPDFIQVGNELNNGMLWDALSSSSATNLCYANSTGTVMTNFISYINRGVAACREVCPRAKVIFHVAMDYNTTLSYANWAAKTWPATLASKGVDYDIIGLSYYPYYHGPLNYLTTLLDYLQTNYPTKEVQLVEVGYPHAFYPTSTSYDYTGTYAATDAGQLAFTNALLDSLKTYTQVTGLYWWWPEANEHGNSGSQVTTAWYNYGLWDNSTGKAMQSLYALQDFTTTQVGATDNTTSWLGATSNVHTVTDGGSIHYTFTQTRNTGSNDYGFLLYAGTAGATPSWNNASVILRGCNYEEKAASSTGCTNDFDWTNFATDMNGATVDMRVSYINGTLAMTSTITTTGSTTYNYSYTKTFDTAPDSIDVCLSVNQACLTLSTDDYEPPYTYLNDFETISGTTAVNAMGNATITGSGSFDATTYAASTFGTVFQNTGGAIRTNYLMLPSDVLAHSAYTHQLTIGFWVNKSSASDYFFTPIFSAHDKAPYSGTLADETTGLVNDWTMLALESRGWGCYNLNAYSGGWSDLTGEQNDAGSNTASTDWLDDAKWHYYTFTITDTSAKVYIDGSVMNSWTIDASAFFSQVGNLTYVTLGGNQYANWVDADPAYAFDDVRICNKALSATEISSIMAEKVFAYTVTAKDGNGTTLKQIASGQSAGQAVTVAYPQYIYQGTTLYQIAANGSGDYYRTTFTPDADGYDKELTYSAATVADVVYFTEAEDIAAASECTYTPRASNGKMGRTANNSTYVAVTELPAGTYRIYARPVRTNDGTGTCNFKVGDDVKFSMTMSKGTYVVQNSDEFTISTTSTLYFACDGSSTSGLDWLYVKGTPANKVIGKVDNSTAYLGDMSDIVTLKPGQAYHYRFVNHNNGGTFNWLNWVLPVYNASERVITVRADFFEDVKGANTGCTANIVWDDFVNQMNGATVDMTVSYSAANVLTMSSTITTSGGSEWWYNYESSTPGVTLSGDLQVALSVSNSWLELEEEGYLVTVSAKAGKYGTVIFPFTPDVSTGFTDITFYSCDAVNTTTSRVQLTEVDEPAANTPYIIYNASESDFSTTVFGKASISDVSYTAGLLTGVIATTTIAASDGSATRYVLQTADGTQAFYTVSSAFTATPYKCYLTVPTTSVKAFYLGFGQTDGIDTLTTVLPAAASTVYDIAGQRTTAVRKGVYIVNGKKVAIK